MTGSAQVRYRPRRLTTARVVMAAVFAVGAIGSVGTALAASANAGPARAGASGGRTSPRVGPAGAATPRGWAAVSYRRAELSVPRLWLVESRDDLFCMPKTPGMIFAGTRPGFPAEQHCALTASLAWIRPAGHIPAGIGHRKPTAVIRGIPVYRQHSGPHSVVYLVPKLSVRVGASGRLARRVLGTLTRSPLAVVLRKGPAGKVPASWTWHRFGGVRFATPPAWDSRHARQWATCGTGVTPQSLLLIDATKPPAALACPFPIPTAAAEQAQSGLTVVTGKFAARSVSGRFTRCQVKSDVRICLSSVTGHGGIDSTVLIFSVSRPHRHPKTFLLLGLAGTGTRARTIFDSVAIARHP